MVSRLIYAVVLAIAFLSITPVWSDELADAPGKTLVLRRCTGCHEAALFTTVKHTRAEWKGVIETMMGYGADVSRADVEIIADYLAMYYGPDSNAAKP